jgi:hypothetical protein
MGSYAPSSQEKSATGTVTKTATTTREQDATFFASLRASLPAHLSTRVVFETVPSTSPITDVIARVSIEVGQNPKNGGDLIVLGRNIGGKGDLQGAAGTLGELAERIWGAKVGASLLVVKAGWHRG